MITGASIIRHIGCFDLFDGSQLPDLKRLVLVYAQNGRGKTTLSAILSSLADNDANRILGRKRLGSQADPHIVLRISDAAQTAVFQNGHWNLSLPSVLVFDDEFTNENVYSGLEVTANHRQRLHEVILGRDGVILARQVDDFTQKIAECNQKLRVLASKIPDNRRFGFEVDGFCKLQSVNGLTEAFTAKQREYDALQDKKSVQTKTLITGITFPALDMDVLELVLSKSIPHLEEAAVTRIKQHTANLGPDAETWIADGVGRIIHTERESDKCPFCSQKIAGIGLIEDYRSYFGQAYTDLLFAIEKSEKHFNTEFGGDQLSEVQKTVNDLIALHTFWKKFVDLPECEIDWDVVSTAWRNARDMALSHIAAKKATPLSCVSLSAEAKAALANYGKICVQIQKTTDALVACNSQIAAVKKTVDSGDLTAVTKELNRLRAIANRHSDEFKVVCDEYLKLAKSKSAMETEKEVLRGKLDGHRAKVFPQYLGAVNRNLSDFGATFQIGDLVSSNAAGRPSTTYHLVVNGHQVQLAGQGGSSSSAGFKNTMSAGDRNTLALAFFFAAIEKTPDISKLTIVFDDPMSSLDDGRTTATIQKIRDLVSRAEQIIVLCHAKPFLCDIWESPGKDDAIALMISRASNNSSVIEEWDVSSDSLTEYDKRHEALRNFVVSQTTDMRRVAQSLRPVMEKYLRITFPAQCLPGTLLGAFRNHAENLARNNNPIMTDTSLRELKNITEYANQFHHDTNSAWATEQISDTELLTYVKRVLNFVKHGDV